MQRRTFLAASASLVPALAQTPIPIIDTHIHLFDPTRKQGVPWPPKDAVMYKPTYPKQLREVSKGLGIVGAIEVECSPWFDDNQWVLDVCEKDTIMVGFIGDLEPLKPEFRSHLDRFTKNKLFRGIRYAYLWGRDFRADMAKPEFITGMKDFAARGLTLDTANPSVKMLEDVLRITDKVPELKVVIDHLPKTEVPANRSIYVNAIRELAKRPKVWVKVSAVLAKDNSGKFRYDTAYYKPKLDEIYETFGQDKVIFGSDWPNSEPSGNYSQVLAVVREYFNGKGRPVAEKYFWKNSVAAYKWIKRDGSQPSA
ncbi:MAG: amidohydrolase family protein [Bryobacteraceae bacterium]